MLIAAEKGAELIVSVGSHFNLVEFLDKNRAGMSSTFLTRLRVGEILVDAKGVSRLYRPRPGAAPLLLRRARRASLALRRGRARDARPARRRRPAVAQAPGPARHRLVALARARRCSTSATTRCRSSPSSSRSCIGILLGVAIGDSGPGLERRARRARSLRSDVRKAQRARGRRARGQLQPSATRFERRRSTRCSSDGRLAGAAGRRSSPRAACSDRIVERRARRAGAAGRRQRSTRSSVVSSQPDLTALGGRPRGHAASPRSTTDPETAATASAAPVGVQLVARRRRLLSRRARRRCSSSFERDAAAGSTASSSCAPTPSELSGDGAPTRTPRSRTGLVDGLQARRGPGRRRRADRAPSPSQIQWFTGRTGSRASTTSTSSPARPRWSSRSPARRAPSASSRPPTALLPDRHRDGQRARRALRRVRARRYVPAVQALPWSSRCSSPALAAPPLVRSLRARRAGARELPRASRRRSRPGIADRRRRGWSRWSRWRCSHELADADVVLRPERAGRSHLRARRRRCSAWSTTSPARRPARRAAGAATARAVLRRQLRRPAR